MLKIMTASGCVCACHVSMTNASHGCQQAVIPRHRDKPLYNTAENVIRCCQINFPTFHQTDHQMTGGQPWHSHTSQCPLKQLYSQGWENMTPMWMPFPTHTTLLTHITADATIKRVQKGWFCLLNGNKLYIKNTWLLCWQKYKLHFIINFI